MSKQRDLTWRQFVAALKRNGFKHEFLAWFKDTTGQVTNVSFPGIFYRDGTIAKRATIAHLIQSRAKELKTRRRAQ